tara:strand:+ start:161 stop:607 length:447 start_codon:yes stop_codon:yes gene_type:complete
MEQINQENSIKLRNIITDNGFIWGNDRQKRDFPASVRKLSRNCPKTFALNYFLNNVNPLREFNTDVIDKNNELKDEINELKEQNERLRQRIEVLRTHIDNIPKLKQDLSYYKQQYDNQTEIIKELRRENEILKGNPIQTKRPTLSMLY